MHNDQHCDDLSIAWLLFATGVDGPAGAECSLRLVPAQQGRHRPVLVRNSLQGQCLWLLDDFE